MSDRHVSFALVGGGVAAAACAERLREFGADGSIVLVGREPDPPYERPPCSKRYLRGLVGREELLLHPPGWWEERGVEVLTRTSAMKLDAAERRLALSSRETLSFDRALLATGALVRRLGAPGAELEGIHYLRTLGNADAIRSDAERAHRVVVIGGSFLGCELAVALASLGLSCTIVMQERLPLERGFGEPVGGFVLEALQDRGVEVLGEDELAAYAGSDGRVTGVATKRGRSLPADMVVVAAGAIPEVMLARRAGLELGATGGVATDRFLESSVPGIYAAGDMCEYDSVSHGRPVRIEHWEVAAAQGRTAAANMLGGREAHDEVPYFWCDLGDTLRIESVAAGADWDDEVVSGTPDQGDFGVWRLRHRCVVGAVTVGRPSELEEARRLIASGEAYEPGALARTDGGSGQPVT